eukprot:CAMPEP_0170607414 /NCGR_PEP_ID=MMETSP0224-20130122/21040_1 /TAXON_ID=285029 /ORGANISM="Togula jolla, Strain CCCM 725" /LENGTH=179 /DNA_ID=CAMNT_0010932575 /DNA_START=419 /DNA_END=956 /DNA_ORIENTATION=-
MPLRCNSARSSESKVIEAAAARAEQAVGRVGVASVGVGSDNALQALLSIEHVRVMQGQDRLSRLLVQGTELPLELCRAEVVAIGQHRSLSDDQLPWLQLPRGNGTQASSLEGHYLVAGCIQLRTSSRCHSRLSSSSMLWPWMSQVRDFGALEAARAKAAMALDWQLRRTALQGLAIVGL